VEYKEPPQKRIGRKKEGKRKTLDERKKRIAMQAAKKLLTSIKEKGSLGKKSPLTRKESS